jgi:hypothetical protein
MMFCKFKYELSCSCSELLGLLLHDGLSSHSVGGIADHGWEGLAHANLGQSELVIEGVPELRLVRLGSEVVEVEVKVDGFQHSVGSLETLVVSEVLSGSSLSEDEVVHVHVVSSAEELVGSGGISGSASTGVDSGLDGVSEGVSSVAGPDSLEVGLGRDLLGHLVRVEHSLLLDHLGGHCSDGVVLSLEGNSALLGGGVHTEGKGLVLVAVGERVEDVIGVIQMSSVSLPPWLGHLVVEKSGRHSFTKLLKSEPLDDVGLLSLSEELHGGPLGVEILHGVVPGLSGVSINLPVVHLVGSSPVRHLEALEEGSGSSVEGDVSDTLEQIFGVEVLSVDVVVTVGLLVEFMHVEVLDSDSYIILNLN